MTFLQIVVVCGIQQYKTTKLAVFFLAKYFSYKVKECCALAADYYQQVLTHTSFNAEGNYANKRGHAPVVMWRILFSSLLTW